MPQKHHRDSKGDPGPSALYSKCSLPDTERANPEQFLLLSIHSLPHPHWLCKIHTPECTQTEHRASFVSLSFFILFVNHSPSCLSNLLKFFYVSAIDTAIYCYIFCFHLFFKGLVPKSTYYRPNQSRVKGCNMHISVWPQTAGVPKYWWRIKCMHIFIWFTHFHHKRVLSAQTAENCQSVDVTICTCLNKSAIGKGKKSYTLLQVDFVALGLYLIGFLAIASYYPRAEIAIILWF